MDEICRKCGSANFAVARDMKGTRKCKCGNTWLPSNLKELTDWEVGQNLIRISDEMGQLIYEFKHSHPNIYKEMDQMRAKIGDMFSGLKSHTFGIYSSKDKQS